MTFRKFIFWAHLTAASVAALVILIMCVTGVLLAYERQINSRADRSHVSVITPGSQRLPLENLVAHLAEAQHGSPVALRFHASPDEPVEATYEGGRTLLVNPYMGDVVGEPSKGSRRFFEIVERWHRYLGTQGANRTAGRALTGVSTVLFLFLVVTGPYLWLPRKWVWTRVRSATLFQSGLKGRARLWNWHNVAGIWSALPLLIVVFTGTTMSYPNLLYRLTGGENMDPRAPAPFRTARTTPRWDGLEALRIRAERQVPDWQSITMRLPGSTATTLAFLIDRGDGGQPEKRSTLTLNRETGEVVQWDTFSNNNIGRKLRLWSRYAHTGEQIGILGETIAGLASLGGAVLACTGLMLAAHRLLSRRARRTRVASAMQNPQLV